MIVCAIFLPLFSHLQVLLEVANGLSVHPAIHPTKKEEHRAVTKFNLVFFWVVVVLVVRSGRVGSVGVTLSRDEEEDHTCAKEWMGTLFLGVGERRRRRSVLKCKLDTHTLSFSHPWRRRMWWAPPPASRSRCRWRRPIGTSSSPQRAASDWRRRRRSSGSGTRRRRRPSPGGGVDAAAAVAAAAVAAVGAVDGRGPSGSGVSRLARPRDTPAPPLQKEKKITNSHFPGILY